MWTRNRWAEPRTDGRPTTTPRSQPSSGCDPAPTCSWKNVSAASLKDAEGLRYPPGPRIAGWDRGGGGAEQGTPYNCECPLSPPPSAGADTSAPRLQVRRAGLAWAVPARKDQTPSRKRGPGRRVGSKMADPGGGDEEKQPTVPSTHCGCEHGGTGAAPLSLRRT